MYPKLRQRDAFGTNNSVRPQGSGYYPVAEKVPSSASPRVEDPPRDSDVEIRVLSDEYPNALTFEVWTERTVYKFDANLCCIAARNRETGEIARCQYLGARLLGGRYFQDQLVDMSAPLPCVGHSAVLSIEDGKTIITSPVTRVIMYVWRWSSSRNYQPGTHGPQCPGVMPNRV